MTAVLSDVPGLLQSEGISILRGLRNGASAFGNTDISNIDLAATHRGLSFFIDGLSMLDALESTGKAFERMQNVYDLVSNNRPFQDRMSAVYELTKDGAFAVGETLYSLLFLHEIEAIELATDQIAYIKIVAGVSEAYAFVMRVCENGEKICNGRTEDTSGNPISREVQNWTFRYNAIQFVKNVSLYALSLFTAISAFWAISIAPSVTLVISSIAVAAAITGFFAEKSMERASAAEPLIV